MDLVLRLSSHCNRDVKIYVILEDEFYDPLRIQSLSVFRVDLIQMFDIHGRSRMVVGISMI